ncbi:E3 ubiquitin-protein ligase TRIM71 [Stylophora pistillata]|uniref:E3 ubiquitin-protein ligase TRIM71 n=1 Tax=Stylophora pistillata TaxID=50429 RepID=A0A2B4SVA0_STYPI|nr:E3 ubiquitin-protein ligase TRIM71 [Stylophora pistillata]
MASVASTASSTKETTNYARLCRLLVDIGTQALRDTLDAIHAPANLPTVLAANKPTLQSLRNKKIINPIQWGKLFPVIPTSVSSRDFDTTLLMVVLRNLSGLTAPLTGWDALPAVTDLSKEADIARVKYFRNTVYSHAEKASVDDIKFNDYWRDIRDTLVRLGGITYEAAIDNLRNECMDPKVEDHYTKLLGEWKKDEDNIKDQLNEIKKRLDTLTAPEEAIDQGQSHQPRNQISCGVSTCKESFHVNKPLDLYCHKCQACFCPRCGQSAHGRVVQGNTDHSQSTTRGKGLVEAEQGAEANFTIITRDSRERLFYDEREQVTVTVSSQTGNEEEPRSVVRPSPHSGESQPHQPRNQISCGVTTCKESFHVNKPLDLYCHKCQACFCPRCGQSAHGRVVQGNTDHSQSTTRGKGLVEAEQGAEANFTIITRDSRERLFYDEREQVTVTVSSQTGNEEVQVVDCKDGHYRVCYKPKSVGRHDIEIRVNGWSLTGSPWKVEVKPHQYKVVRSSGSGELSGPYCIAKNEITGDIAVADYINKRVQVFDKDMKHVKTIIGGKADSQRWANIGCPVSVAFSKSNDIMVTHEQFRSQNKKLSVITDRGLFIEHFTKHLIKAHHVFVKTEDGHVIVCDEGDRKIKEISSDGKELLLAFSAPDSEVNPSFPYFYRGMFFVSYMRAHCVKVFDKKGVFLYNIGNEGSGEGKLRYPEGLSVDFCGNLIVCDASGFDQNLHRSGVLKMFTLDGAFLTSFGEDTFKVPWIVSSCNNGELLVADVVGDSVHILR